MAYVGTSVYQWRCVCVCASSAIMGSIGAHVCLRSAEGQEAPNTTPLWNSMACVGTNVYQWRCVCMCTQRNHGINGCSHLSAKHNGGGCRHLEPLRLQNSIACALTCTHVGTSLCTRQRGRQCDQIHPWGWLKTNQTGHRLCMHTSAQHVCFPTRLSLFRNHGGLHCVPPTTHHPVSEGHVLDTKFRHFCL